MEWFAGNDGNDNPVVYDMTTESDTTGFSDGLYFFQGGTSGPLVGGEETWDLQWDVRTTESGLAGPPGGGAASVTANLTVTNLTLQRQVFTSLVTVNLDNAIIGGTNISGDVSATILDLFGSGDADVSTVTDGGSPFFGDPIYEGFIDGIAPGNSVKTLWDDPFSLTYNGVPGGTNADDTNFGTEAGPAAANNTISVWLKVEVSPLDQATVLGTLNVSPVPAPGALALLGLAGLAGSRRRRS